MRKSKRVVALGMVAALGLIAAACGGDDDEGGSATTTAGGGATTTAGAATTAGGATTSAAPPDIGELLTYDESAQCGVDPYTGNLAKIEAVDALTVKFTLCSPDVAFPSKVAFSAFGSSPSEYLESTGGTGDFIEKPIGTGPYKLERRGTAAARSCWSANDDYWGEPPRQRDRRVPVERGGRAAARRAAVRHRRRHRQRRHRRLRERSRATATSSSSSAIR